MPVDVLIGLKRLDAAKSRLADAAPAGERAGLMRAWVARSAAAARGAAGVGRVALASSDPAAAAFAVELRVGHLDDGGLPWNDGLAHALAALVPAAEAVLYLAGDLPFVEQEDVEALLAAGDARGVVVARACDGGTNALLVRPAGALAPRFGEPASATVHVEAARAAGLPAVVVDRPGLAFDVDTAGDLADYRKRSLSASRTSERAEPSPRPL